MILSDLRLEETRDWTRLSVRMVWEEVEEPPRRLWIEARAEDRSLLASGWEPFAVAAYPVAVAAGERRLAVEGTLCPRLADDLPLYGHAIAGPDAPLPRVEPIDGRRAPFPAETGATASFLSGGVDALALLRANQLEYDEAHPGRIRIAINVFGLNTYDFADGEPVAAREAVFSRYLRRLESFGDIVGVRVVPVRTNTRDFYEDFAAWGRGGSVAGTVAAGLALAGGVRALWLASDGFRPNPRPVVAQVFNAHHLSNTAVEVRAGHASVSRLEKTRMIADWPAASGVLRTCYYVEIPEAGRINCGRCEKCVRTMLALVASDRLDRIEAFERDDLEPADVAAVGADLLSPWEEFYLELVEPLQRAGRADLAHEAAAMAERVMSREASRPGFGRRLKGVMACVGRALGAERRR